MTTEADNKELVRTFHEQVLTEKNLDAVEDLFARDYVEHNPALPDGEMRGRDNIVQFWTGLFEAFPDLSVTEEDGIAEGDMIATRHIGRGTHEGAFMDLEPTGNEFEIEGIDLYRIEGGKIVESWVSLDMLGMMQQLGVVEPPGE
jgi:predicted ester cyclase